MASTASLKELSKAISAYIPEPTLPLPDNLIEVIAAYLRKHLKYDDAASDRLQEELLCLFDKHVKGNNQATIAWWAILRQLLPVLQTSERILQWLKVSRGAADSVTLDKGSATEAVASMMALVTAADEYHDSSSENGRSNPIIDHLFSVWMERFYPTSLEGNISAIQNEKLVRDALMEFGKKRPLDFFASLDAYLVRKEHRKAALRFFCDFLQSRPPHLYEIEKSSLFTNLLTCLQTDTSTAIISAALTALIMILPSMPGSLVPHLPALFNIYARLLFWERERAGSADYSLVSSADQDKDWDACKYEPDVEDATVNHLGQYYTILYGLYPINFMDYIRKPQRYLRHANVPNADDVEVQPSEIRHQSEKFRRCHLLHPNFYTLTIESEKTDFGRWVKSEAADVFAECMELCLEPENDQLSGNELASPRTLTVSSPQEGSDKADPEPALLAHSITIDSRMESWRKATMSAESYSTKNPSAMVRQPSTSSQPSTADARSREHGPDSPTLPTDLARSPSHTQLQDMIQSNKVIKSGLHQTMTNDSVPSLALSQHESTEKPEGVTLQLPQSVSSPMSLTESGSQLSHLQRQILLLQNDLSFERYMKQQHIAHIGDLRKRQMAEVATESETQNLILNNRNLKSRFEEAKKAEVQVRKESELSRARAKKWEADLANKLKNLRDEFKKTNAQLDAARRELDNSKEEADKLRKLVCDAEVKELKLKQNMQSIDIHAEEFKKLKSEVERLTLAERDYQAREQERMVATRSAAEAESRAETLNLKLTAVEAELQRTKKLFQTQVGVLQEKLVDAADNEPRRDASVREEVKEALAASRAKQAEMQKQYDHLMRRFTAMQSSTVGHDSAAPPSYVNSGPASVPEKDKTILSMSSSPVTLKARMQRVLSNPEIPETTSYNTTRPLDTTGSHAQSTALPLHPVSSPDNPAGSDGPASIHSTSPEHRMFGRGGLQNRTRREGKEKQKDDAGSGSGNVGAASNNNSSNRKDKKSTGLRTIRGLM